MEHDKAGREYWNKVWEVDGLPLPVNPNRTDLRNHVNARFHEFFCDVFSRFPPRDRLLLEVGCARSAWLPYFSQQFGCQVYGLDYSEIGCEQSRKILEHANVQGEIILADFYSPPPSLIGKFDFVVTFGVVEHFADTRSCIAALSRFLKPGGVLVTSIPNMAGIIGALEKLINRPVYDIHVPLDARQLAAAHQIPDMKVLECKYFLSTNFGVLNLNGIDPATITWKIKRIFLKLLYYFSNLVWLCERSFGYFKPTRVMSPHINCVARKEN